MQKKKKKKKKLSTKNTYNDKSFHNPLKKEKKKFILNILK